MAESGHPICGERVYAAPRKGARADDLRVPRVMLHAAELGFVHPVTGAELRFTSPLPADMRKVITGLRRQTAKPAKPDTSRERGRGPERGNHQTEARDP